MIKNFFDRKSIFLPIDKSLLLRYYSNVNNKNSVMENVRILLADDNKNFRRGLAEFINNQYGFKIIGEANDGMEALNLIVELKPDVVMLDVSMPKLDGITAARFIKKEYPDLFIIIITIHDEKVFQELASVIPVDGFIGKASISEELPAVLSSLKDKRDSLRPVASERNAQGKKV